MPGRPCSVCGEKPCRTRKERCNKELVRRLHERNPPCRTCGQSDRYKSGICRNCAAESRRRYYENKGGRERLRAWLSDPANREKHRGYQLKYRASNKRLAADLAKYGLSVEQYEALLAAQSGGCAVCGLRPPFAGHGRRKRLCIDHCHRTGKVRGLLCGECNQALGKLRDDVNLIRRLASYLERHGGT